MTIDRLLVSDESTHPNPTLQKSIRPLVVPCKKSPFHKWGTHNRIGRLMQPRYASHLHEFERDVIQKTPPCIPDTWSSPLDHVALSRVASAFGVLSSGGVVWKLHHIRHIYGHVVQNAWVCGSKLSEECASKSHTGRTTFRSTQN